MYIDQRHYNELNISTIDYHVKYSNQNFEVRKLEGASWIFNKTAKEFIKATKNSWGGTDFKLLDEKSVNELKIDAKEKRNRLNMELNSSKNGYGIREKDVKEAESEAKNTEKNFSSQKQIMEKK